MKYFSILLSAICIFLSSCASNHRGSISHAHSDQPLVFEDIAVGTSVSHRYFGFGGHTNDGLVLNAKRSMMQSRPLKENEKYINFTVDFKITQWPFVRQTLVIVSADVVRLPFSGLGDTFSENYKQNVVNNGAHSKLFKAGDSVYIDYDFDKPARIINIESYNKVSVMYRDENNQYRIKRVMRNRIYTTLGEIHGLRAGDHITITNHLGVRNLKAEVLMLAEEGALLYLTDYNRKHIWAYRPFNMTNNTEDTEDETP